MNDKEKLEHLEEFFEYLFLLPGKKVKWLKEYKNKKTDYNTYIDIICNDSRDFKEWFNATKRTPCYDKKQNIL